VKHTVLKIMPAKIQNLLRKFLPKLLKSQMGHKYDWFEKLHTKLHFRAKDYLLRMSPLSSVIFTDHYGAGNLEPSLRLESDTTNYPPVSLRSPDLAN
jgi:hypothetical protein